MPRYKLTIEYDGGPFVGWQRQHNGPSIQAALEDAILAFSGERPVVTGAGRTDAGVHALGQVVHFDLTDERPVDTVRSALNFHLRPNPIAVVSAEIAEPGFHARFSATWRSYCYRIINRRAPPALDRNQLWHVAVPLDSEAMAEAARTLVGHHDFNSFRSTACQSPTALKTIDRLDIERHGDEIRIDVGARSFLHNQVRIMVGTLQLVGRGQWSRRDVEEALAARDRTRAGPTAPPQGLCLTAVCYGSGADSGRDAEEAVDDD